jgi:beta-mannosidase
MSDRKLTVKWELWDKSAQIISEETISLKVPALSSEWLPRVEVPNIQLYDEYLSYHSTS